MAFKKPCLDCGQLTNGKTRCENCALEYGRRIDAKRDKTKRELYKGDYRARSRQVRQDATVCWICGDSARPDDPWQADHLIPDDPLSPLAPAHRSCNIKRALELRRANEKN